MTKYYGGSKANCSDLETAKIVFTLYLASAAFSSIFYVAAILLIVAGKAYRQLVHRLILYLCLGGLLRAGAHVLHVIPIDVERSNSSVVGVRGGGSDGWNNACIVGAFFIQYTGFFQTFTVVWISTYVFLLAVYSRRLGRRKHEIIGVTVVIVCPLLLFTWEPFITHSYGLDDVACGIVDATCGPGDAALALAYKLGLNVAPHLFMTALGLILLIVSMLTLAVRARHAGVDSLASKSAIMKIMPLTMYPFFYSLIFVGRMVGLIANVDTKSDLITLVLLEMAAVSLPLSLLVRKEIRQVICPRKGRPGELEALTGSMTNTLPCEEPVYK